jgi:polyhydroxybutyrate depolymerase
MKTAIQTSIGLLVSFVLVGGCLAQTPNPPLGRGSSEGSISLGELQRTYRLHVPVGYSGKTKVPAVIVLHGYSGNAKLALAQGQWIEKSEQENFIAVALDGMPRTPSRFSSLMLNPKGWNSGEPLEPFGRGPINDVSFVNAIIDRLLATGMVDEDRIYVTGFSNGAAMTFRVGAELSDRIAAIAPVSDGLYVTPNTLKRPVPLLLLWGTADPINPSSGGTVRRFGKTVTVTSAEKSWKTWGSLLGCSNTPQTIYAQDGVQGFSLKDCPAHSEALFYSVENMGHHWPGGKNFVPKSIVGQDSNAINATDLIWKFFTNHVRQK